jgi:hypothetical protein
MRFVEPMPLMQAPPLKEVPGQRRVSVFLPWMHTDSMSGGPNTAILLALRLADVAKIPVRFVSTDRPCGDVDELWRHFLELTETSERRPHVTFADLHDRSRPFELGTEEVILATAWWTAQPAARMLQKSRRPRPYLYLVQDYEPGLYAWSTEYALAEETYAMDMRAIVNEGLVLDYLVERRQGRFASPGFRADHCVSFEPALDVRKFHPGDIGKRQGKRRLLFYARPMAPRNLYPLGLMALKDAVDRGAFAAAEWELCQMGEKTPDVDLGKGQVLRTLPWRSFDEYARTMRESDAGLSLMLSPHTSYPPLEMAACGLPCVTTCYGTKTTERLLAISKNLIPVVPDREDLVVGLLEAHARSQDHERRRRDAQAALPRSWNDAFDAILPRVVALVREAGGW